MRRRARQSEPRPWPTEPRAWITSLPALTFFRPDAVPGGPGECEPLLRELLAAEWPIIGIAIEDRLYYRQPPPVDRRYQNIHLRPERMAQALLPLGSGLEGYSALWAAGWTQQVPVRHGFAVVDEKFVLPPFPGQGHRGAVVRPNQRRVELTWHEVTLLEAAHAFRLADFENWRLAKSQLFRLLRMRAGSSALIRRDKLLWAAELEQPDPGLDDRTREQSPLRFEAVMKRLRRWLPRELRDLP